MRLIYIYMYGSFIKKQTFKKLMGKERGKRCRGKKKEGKKKKKESIP